MLPFIHNSLNDTFPVVAHFPGGTRNKPKTEIGKLFKQLSHPVKKGIPHQIIKPDDLTIITWNSESSPSLLEQGLNNSNIPYVVLGQGQRPWSYILKIHLTHKALNRIETPYVMGLDAYDVIVCGDLQRAIDQLKIKKCQMLLNGDTNLFPRCPPLTDDIEQFQKSMPNSKRECRYLNSGVWITTYDFCKKYFEDCIHAHPPTEQYKHPTPPFTPLGTTAVMRPQNPPRCDQAVFNYLFTQLYPDMQLDYNCDVFQVVNFLSAQHIAAIPQLML